MYYYLNICQQSNSPIYIMERTLATVNINMGWGQNNPVLIITRSTNVPQLVGQFIANFNLPSSAYDAIMSAIQKQLTRENIDMDTLGRQSLQQQRRSTGPNSQSRHHEKIERPQLRNKKVPVSWDQLKEKKQFPITRIEFQKKTASPVLQKEQIKKQQAKQAKITLIRTKSPILKKDRSPCDTKRTKSPAQNRTPLRERQLTEHHHKTNPDEKPTQLEVLSQIFDWLTRNQPKTMRVLNPEYVSFTGVKPAALAVLQDFFEIVEENQFLNMDKNYFIRRIKQVNMGRKLAQAFE